MDNTTERSCLWCSAGFEPRSNGRKPQPFYSKDCRQDFFATCRDWAVSEIEAWPGIGVNRQNGSTATCTLRKSRSAPRSGSGPRNEGAPWRASDRRQSGGKESIMRAWGAIGYACYVELRPTRGASSVGTSGPSLCPVSSSSAAWSICGASALR